MRTSRIRGSGPTRIGSISLSLAASTALSSETSSQGWATAMFTGGWSCAVRNQPVKLLVGVAADGGFASSTGIRHPPSMLAKDRRGSLGINRYMSATLPPIASAERAIPGLSLSIWMRQAWGFTPILAAPAVRRKVGHAHDAISAR